MAYSKTNWENLPSTQTPINASNLNNIETGIDNTLTALGLANDTYDNTKTYAIDDMVVYNNKIYSCSTAVTTAEDFDETKWTVVPITNNEKINQKLLPNYSTQEVKVGTWINGKPLYRKIYQYRMPQCATSGTPVIESHTIDINNVEFSFLEFGFVYANFITAPLPYITRQSPSQNIGYDLTTPTNLRIWNSFKDWNNSEVLVSILYTKTTD